MWPALGERVQEAGSQSAVVVQALREHLGLTLDGSGAVSRAEFEELLERVGKLEAAAEASGVSL